MNKINVGFQGVSGSFSEQALDQYFGLDINKSHYTTFEDVFIAIKEGIIQYGVLPIENSTTGAITINYDLLNKYELYITGETYVKVNQNLLGIKGSTIDDIKEVYSHPQGFEQSKAFLSQYDWKLNPYYNTAKSAKFVLDSNNKSIGAIASKKAAAIYNLEILKENIHCNHQNTTRFIIIANTLERKDTSDKISVVLSTKHQAGALYHVMKHFAKFNLNMTKIESRPIQHTPFEYLFYIDFEGNLLDDLTNKAIDIIRKDCHYFRILGNYKSNRI